jgi:hypothetical protein
MICSRAPLSSGKAAIPGCWMSLLRSALSRSEQTNMGSSVTTLQSWGARATFQRMWVGPSDR